MKATIRFDEPLARHTALRTGGHCVAWVVVHDEDSLIEAISDCADAGWKWTLLGAGTRLVMRDGGFDGVVIRLGPAFAGITHQGDTLEIGAATPVPAVLAHAASHGLTGLEDLAGIAGSVGASVIHDAGWKRTLVSGRVLRRGKIRTLEPGADLGRGRSVVLSVQVRLQPDDTQLVQARMGMARVRPNAFEPDRSQVRHCLQRADLVGVRLRGIAIPDAAPEMVVNLGGGTAGDVALLHKSVRDRVRKEQGVDLGSNLRWAGTKQPTA